ncbi:MAG: hypothetical protein IPP81_19035 [Chitinophagaceae bacterium]|nr:hypothetical protein [Chitinophagaceae bacterium]
MTKINSLLLTFSLITMFASCNAQNSDNAKSYYSDTAIFKIDTTINNVLIDGKQFSVKVLRDKFDEHLERFTENDEPNFEQSPMTVILTNGNDGKIIYIKKFDFEPNDYPSLKYSFYKGQLQNLNDNGRLYLMLNKGYGGSGSQSIRYYINFNENKINFSELFTSSGELSYIVYNKNDNEIIVLDGIWNMKENETHFASHRYTITKYTYRNNGYDKKVIGQTKFKYSSLDEEKPIAEILIDIKTKEPLLLKGINLTDYK